MAGLGRPGPGPRAGMPAWKREILERKRAKLAALSGGSAAGTDAAAGTGADAAAAAAGERLVLAESLGPLCENPFMRLESERRRGAGRRGGGAGAGAGWAAAAGARPVQQLLELYRRVPGVRTIRADNILIIESVPGFPPADPEPPAAGAGLAARIRAAEVLVYEAPPPPGRVSRLLQKFDPPPAAPSAPSAPSTPSTPRRRGSPERARPPPPPPPQQQQQPEPPGPAAPRVSERAARLEPERRGLGPGARRSDFVQKTGHNSFTVHPRGLHRPLPLPNGPAAGAANGPAGSSRGRPGAADQPKVGPGEPPSPGTTPSATAASPPASPRPSPASATPSQRRGVSAATSANDSFEIRPACKPDLDAIPAGDLQARALASLRVNSRHSFLFIPKRQAAATTSSTSTTSTSTGAPPPAGRPAGQQRAGGGGAAQPGSGVDGRAPAPEKSPWRAPEPACPRPATAPVDPAARWPRAASPPPSPSLLPAAAAEAEPSQGFGAPGPAKNGGEPGRPGLPVTFIDEVDSEDEVPQEAKLPARHHLPSERPHHAAPAPAPAGNTFTVVPKRKPGALQANGEPGAPEADCLAEPPAALKKRYPTVHEIEVIGGYLALQKSCLTKAGSSRKKMKISFNDKSLHTTFEYPSESSLVQEAQAEAEGEEAGEEEDEEEEEEGGSGLNGAVEKPFALFLPRATFVNSVAPDSPRLPDGSSGLSSYTPKHSVSFSKWQEQPVAQAPGEVEPSLKEVMLTPACPNALSDFRSEPALYF